MPAMKILGIETSCDETACAIVEDGAKVLSNVIFSQVDLHAKTGGVVPEVAAREHILKIIPVIDEALKKAGCEWKDIDAIAVTKGPGLISSLIIGTETASAISYVKGKILIPVHHVIGHIYANFLDVLNGDEIKFPVLVLTVSGGHNELILMKGHNDFEILGETRDDAAGEAFDKVARILGLGYPGGPKISEAAKKGNSSAFKLPRSFLEEGSLDFSFSGVKTAVLNEVKEFLKANKIEKAEELPDQFRADLAASFQEAAVDVLSEKIVQALLKFEKEGLAIREVHLAGGVSANSRLREILTHKISLHKTKLRWPNKIAYCTDNAAMIACAGYYLYKSNPRKFKKAQNLTPTTSFDLF